MTIISFTGVARRLSRNEKRLVRHTIEQLRGEPTLFFSGAATGVDVFAAACAMGAFPAAKHVILVPHYRRSLNELDQLVPCQHDAAAVAQLQADGADVLSTGAVGTEATGYMRRNDMLAVNCTHMVAFPPTGEEQLRDGTWATVRRARDLGRPVLVVPLNGDDRYTIRPS